MENFETARIKIRVLARLRIPVIYAQFDSDHSVIVLRFKPDFVPGDCNLDHTAVLVYDLHDMLGLAVRRVVGLSGWHCSVVVHGIGMWIKSTSTRKQSAFAPESFYLI
jgi:hypothetical protein